MWVKVLHRFCRLLVIVAYAGATITAAATPLAACPTLDLDHQSHAGHAHGTTDHEHGKHSGSQPGDCLNCCIGTCLLGVSLPPPSSGATSVTFYGTAILYAFEQSVLTGRSIPPDPDPPKPLT